MCGIAGAFNPDATQDWGSVAPLLRAMTNAISHRGPDADGHHIEPHVALGHRRLSVIDIATGIQPLFNEDGSVSVVYNGEIYNFEELMAELKALGHVFKTLSDTEVIVHAWEQWGVECLSKFRGMFAFALWDRNLKTFFLARDRLGVKPIYYGIARDKTLYFGSELKAVLKAPRISRDLDPTAVEDYFAYGYVPEPKSIYRAVQKLPSAHFLLWRAGDKDPTIHSYWDVRFANSFKGTEADMHSELIERLNEAEIGRASGRERV